MPKMEFLRRSLAGAAAGAALAAGVADAQTIPVTVTATRADCVEAPVSLLVPEAALKAGKKAPADAVAALCQAEPAGKGQVRVTFLVRDLKKGQSRVYALTPGAQKRVDVAAAGKNAEVKIGGALFTRYDTTTGPNKPYLYPIVAFDGRHLTRRWPLETAPGEAQDHPHHRGLWFTHGEMNEADFWSESDKAGKTVHTGFAALTGGPIQGRIEAATDWVTHEGKTIARDTRTIVVTPLSSGILLDFTVTVSPVGGPLTWGDTKEGTFAIRVPESMKVDKPGTGTLVNAEGLSGAALWGKPSPWNDYFGPVGGEVLGMAIFDNPANPRFPTTWHSRTYGLYAANPFGLHDFDPAKKDQRHAGDLVTPEGKTTTFAYRVFFHKGDTKAAGVADAYAAWANPPEARLL